MTRKSSGLRPIGNVLEAFLCEIGAPPWVLAAYRDGAQADTPSAPPRQPDHDVAELRRRIRSRVTHDALWSAGAPGEQLNLEVDAA